MILPCCFFRILVLQYLKNRNNGESRGFVKRPLNTCVKVLIQRFVEQFLEVFVALLLLSPLFELVDEMLT